MPNARENQQQHIIRTKLIHYDFCIIMHLTARQHELAADHLQGKVFYSTVTTGPTVIPKQVAGLLGAANRPPGACFFLPIRGRQLHWRPGPPRPHRNYNTGSVVQHSSKEVTFSHLLVC